MNNIHRVSEMLKWLVRCFNWLYKRIFAKKQNRSSNLASGKVVQPLPELTNADLEFLFTQLLEGVHQGRGQHWVRKYLERIENRISNQRWIDWLLDFGEKLLFSAAPNHELATRMVQLGELEIGTIGELAYEIGVSILTRNLGESSWQIEENTETTTPAQSEIGYLDELVWEYERLDTAPPPLLALSEEENQALALVELTGESEENLQPVAVTQDEFFVSFEQNTSFNRQLASPLDMEASIEFHVLEQAQTWFYQGLQQAKTGDLIGAIASYNKAVEINPNSYEYWFNRGLTLFYLGNLSLAIASYDKAIEVKPDFYKAWYNKGGALGELEHFEDAIACFDVAIEIKYDYHEAWASRGMALLNLGHPWLAISSYDQALLVAPQNPEYWYERGIALALGGQIFDAIASYDKALEVQPDFYLAWYKRGVELCHLERYEDAVASLNQAILINPDSYEVWYAVASATLKLGNPEQAIKYYYQVLELKPNYHEVWLDLGVVLANIGRWDEALLAWEKALLINPDLHLAWFNSALALLNLGHAEDAIASYDQAIQINPDFYLAWYNRGVALFYLQRLEEAIASYDQALQIKPDYWEAWIGRGTAAGNAIADPNWSYSTNSALDERGYYGKVASYEEGLKYVYPDTHPEGWGKLYLALGNARYDTGKRHYTPQQYWYQAVTDYNQALTTLTAENFPLLHLEVVQNLIKALLGLGQTSSAQELQHSATHLFKRLVNEPTRSDESKKQLALKFAGFGQLAVEIAVQNGEIVQALEIAELSKNACLTWQVDGWSEEIFSPSYASIQKLLTPTTAIIYWHISPCTLRTFILKYDSPEPIPVFTPVQNIATLDEMPLPEAVERLVKFEDWLADWNQQYQQYRSLTQNRQNKSSHSWQMDMENRLFKLKNILNISTIAQELEGVTKLILIPHRDLYRFPLHALFHLSLQPLSSIAGNFTISYLPSAHIGLTLKSSVEQYQQFLSVESPHSTAYPPLKFAKLESEVISQMFNNFKRIQGVKATKQQLENALASNYTIFHFAGYGIDYLNNPHRSELVLAGSEKLTLAEICILTASLNIVTLSACEIDVANLQSITTEYVGLVTAFLYQGIPYVVSTLWIVESVASSLVMIEFYRQLKQGKSPASALSAATQWLREVTASELKKWYEDLLNNLLEEGSRAKAALATELYKSSKMPVDHQPYNHPYYWAGFTISGKLN